MAERTSRAAIAVSFEFREWRRAKCAGDFNIAGAHGGAIAILSASRTATYPGMTGVTATADAAAIGTLQTLRAQAEDFRQGNLIGVGGSSVRLDQEWQRWPRTGTSG